MWLQALHLYGQHNQADNNHDGTFTDVAPQAGVLASGHGFAAWFFDYDNDGRPDLLASGYAMSIEESVRTYLGLLHNAPTMKLYHNLGNGAFRDVTEETGLNKVFMPMGSNFGDVDNDGYPDIYFGTGEPSYAALLPNVLLHNKGGKKFVDITASSGRANCTKGTAWHSRTSIMTETKTCWKWSAGRFQATAMRSGFSKTRATATIGSACGW